MGKWRSEEAGGVHCVTMRVLGTLLVILLIGCTADADRARQILKNVGKRYIHKWLFPVTTQSLEFFFKSEAELNATRNHTAQLFAKHLLTQSSVQNKGFQFSEEVLTSLMSSKLEASICGGPTMNYYQLIAYWKKQRMQFKKNEKEALSYKMLPVDSYIHLAFLVSFKQHSNWGFTAEPTYLVQMELLGEETYSNYSLTSIQEVGACTEYGKVDMDKTDAYLTLFETDPEKRGTRDRVMQHVVGLFETGKAETVVPMEWIKMAAKHEFFTADLCYDGAMLTYSKYEMIRWWKKFQLMWHPKANDTKHTEVQLLGGDYDRYVFRVTMRLQIGVDPRNDVVEWNWKLQVQYNVHGDKEWYINKLELQCAQFFERPVHQMHAEVIKEVIGARIGKMVENPEMWYTCTDFLQDFITADEIEIESCAKLDGTEMEKSKNLRDLEHKFWEENKETNGRMEGYDLGGHREISKIGEKMWIEIFIIWTPLAENQVHESRWRFEIEWNTRLMFYSITKMVFACPQTGKGSKWYSSLRQYP